MNKKIASIGLAFTLLSMPAGSTIAYGFSFGNDNSKTNAIEVLQNFLLTINTLITLAIEASYCNDSYADKKATTSSGKSVCRAS